MKTISSNINMTLMRDLILDVEEELAKTFILFEEEAEKIPDGPQRIRGIAGSGKTRLLCQKAAYMHYKYPEWTIAYTFSSKSLYDEISRTIDRFLLILGKKKDPLKLFIFHSWGNEDLTGLLKTIREKNGLKPIKLGFNPEKEKKESQYINILSKLTLNSKNPIKPIFDAILIDEGQDFCIDKKIDSDLLYIDKQPFYYLAFCACKPSEPEKKFSRRLIWAYDEYQNIDSPEIPSGEGIFGDNKEFKGIISGFHSGKIQKTILLKKSYRTPGPIIIAAHAIGMGFFYKKTDKSGPESGVLSGPKNKKEWEILGYSVFGNFKSKRSSIVLTRPEDNSPNPLTKYGRKNSLIVFERVEDQDKESELIAKQIIHLQRNEQLELSRQMMIVCVIEDKLENHIYRSNLGHTLNKKFGINCYLPTMDEKNKFGKIQKNSQSQNKFWEPDAITITDIRRAKGNEAFYVFVVGIENVGVKSYDITRRNNLFTAMTRTKGWLHMIGIGEYPLYTEIEIVISKLKNNPTEINFNYYGNQTYPPSDSIDFDSD